MERGMSDEVLHLLSLVCFDPVPGSAHPGSSPPPVQLKVPRWFPPHSSAALLLQRGLKWAGPAARAIHHSREERRWEERRMVRDGGDVGSRRRSDAVEQDEEERGGGGAGLGGVSIRLRRVAASR